MRDRARVLRQVPTTSEARLWNWLRNRSFDRCKFRRQVPIGPYVVDFYCHRLRLVIELDGAHHEATWMEDYDDQRTAFLRKAGIEVVRIANVLLARESMTVEEILSAVIRRRREELYPG